MYQRSIIHSEESPCGHEHFEIRCKFAENDMICLEKYWKKWGLTNGNECLRISYESLRIIANFLLTLWLLNNQFAEFLANPLRMLRMLTNALANLANACERLTNETTTQRMRELHNPLPMFRFVTYSPAAAESTSSSHLIRKFSYTNASKSLQMSYDHYKCLAINKNGLRLLTKMLRKQWEYAFLANFRSMFLIFATPMNDRECSLTNTYECLAITLWSLRIGDELHS